MSQRYLIGVFEREEDVLAATVTSREKGYKIVDVHTPYAVHGLDKAMGLQRSRLPWVSFLLGLAGAAFKVWFEYWTTGVDWPINVGGKPWNSLPAFVPVTFEVMVLFAGLSTVAAFFFVSGLRPGRKPRLPHPDVTSHRFVIVLEESDAAFDPDRVKAMFETYHAVHVEEQISEGAP